MSIYKTIKHEVFFIKKLFKDSYGVLAYFRYFKNKFFWKQLIADLPYLGYEVDSNFELHALCQKKDVGILTWSLTSFLYHSELRPRIIIHDDGSIDEVTGEVLKSKFSNLEILSRTEADRLASADSLPENVKKYRSSGHNLILKLIDIFIFSKAKKVMVLDSDILFFNKPQEIIDFISGKKDADALVSRHGGTYDLMVTDSYLNKYQLIERQTQYMNSGLVLYNKDSLRREQLFEYLDNTTRPVDDYWVEMTGWGSLIAQINFEFLPMSTYILKGRPQEDTIMKHFTSPRRQELYAYGIDMVKSKIKNEKS